MLAINATFIGQFIVLLFLLWFNYKVVVPMLARPIDERHRRIAAGLAAAEEGQQSLAQAHVNAEVVIRDARERATHIIDQAQKRANDLLSRPRTRRTSRPLATQPASAQTQIDWTPLTPRIAAQGCGGALRLRAASKVLEREIDPKTHA